MISNSLDKKELDDGYIQQIKEGDGYVLKFNNLPLSSPLKYFKTSGDFSKGTGVINGLSESEAAKSEPNIIIPDGTQQVAQAAFFGNGSIEKLIIADSVEKIGAKMANGSYSLKYVKLSRVLKTVSNFAFRGSSLEKVDWYEGLERIEASAFMSINSLPKTIILPKTVNYIDGGAFTYNTANYTLVTGATSFGENCFAYKAGGSSTPEHIMYITTPNMSDGPMSFVPLCFNGISKLYVNDDASLNFLKNKESQLKGAGSWPAIEIKKWS